MDSEMLKELILEQKKELEKKEDFVIRTKLNELEQYLDLPHVIVISGMRRAGKSTLFLTMSKLLNIDAGSIHLMGKKIEEIGNLDYRRQIALVLQEPLLLLNSVLFQRARVMV